jgi:hypothetical protein
MSIRTPKLKNRPGPKTKLTNLKKGAIYLPPPPQKPEVTQKSNCRKHRKRKRKSTTADS